MVVHDDMDIRLNVSTGPPATIPSSQSPRRSELKSQAERFDKNATSKHRITKKLTSNMNQSSSLKGKKRIKQKALAQIVARNSAKFNKSAHNTTISKSIPKESKYQESQEKKNEVESECSNTAAVTFIKPTETGLRTIIAKPKPQNPSFKKSLADIFSTNNNDHENGQRELLLNSKNIPANIYNKSEKKIFPMKNTSKKDDGLSVKNQNNFSTTTITTEVMKYEKTFNKSGKISSLFGSNPEVPYIGQRLVKPVNEPIFSKTQFSELDIHPFMISNLEQNMSICSMTTVQQKAIPQILSGGDILIRSQTGSGKTLAYAIPIVESLHKIRPKLMRNSGGIRALVVVPTRELVIQTYECFLKLIKPFTWIVPGYLIGGEKRKAEKARLRRGCTILVATPGRLLDHIKHTEALKLSNVKCFVLDEADRMLDMGYEKDISGIVSALKITESDSQCSYDPISMLRQNKKIIFNDDGENDEKEDRKAHKNEMEVAEKLELVGSSKEYHSGTDSDDETGNTSMKTKKSKEINFPSSQTVVDHGTVEQSNSTDNLTWRRQTILLSATLTHAVEKLAGLTMTNPVFIDAAGENLRNLGENLNEINEDLIVPQGVVQSYVVIPPKLRMVTLCAYIVSKCQVPGQHKILIFMATQDMIDFYAEIFPTVLKNPINEGEDQDSVGALVDVEFFKLHGSMTQKDRTEVFKTFRQARSGVLLCTDVAARGLDMPKVDTVVQYTGPLSERDYVHRIGRTARAGSSGTAIIFLTPPEIEFVRALESRRIRIKREDMNDILEKLMGPFSKHLTVEGNATNLQNKFESLLIENKKFHSMACKAYVSWIRFYASYPRDMREIFNRKDLHLGHYAKSFALRDPPSKIGGIGKTLLEKNPTKPEHKNRLSNERFEKKKLLQQSGQQNSQKIGVLKRSRIYNVSEYDDGLKAMKKTKK